EPIPCTPRSALNSGWNRKSMRVLVWGLATTKTDPPWPPSPPLGPPRGTNFSRRNARHPRPPLPASTWMSTSSTNIQGIWELDNLVIGELLQGGNSRHTILQSITQLPDYPITQFTPSAEC